MAIATLSPVSGNTMEELINAIERQRKDIEFLLAHLDDNNISKLSGNKIVVGNASLEFWADGIQSIVKSQDDQLASAQSTITQTAAKVELKVEKTDFNGEKIVSLIEQTAENISLSAKKIDLLGITHVASEIQIGSETDDGIKALKFRGTNSWIYDNITEFVFATNYPVKWYAPGITFTGANSADFSSMNYIDFSNCTQIDFSGSVVTGMYAYFG